MINYYIKTFKSHKYQKTLKCLMSTTTNTINSSSNIMLSHEVLFKTLFSVSSSHFKNLMYIIYIFFNVNFETNSHILIKDNANGFELFLRLIFNPYFKIESQVEFDKLKSLLTQKIAVFSMFYLLLTQVLSCTQGFNYPGQPLFKTCSAEGLNFFAVIKSRLVQQLNTLNEQYTFSKNSVGQSTKVYNPIFTFNKLLNILEENNLFILEQILQTPIGKSNYPFAYSYACPEIFDFCILDKTNLPFSKERFQDFLALYVGLSELKHLIQKSFNSSKKKDMKDSSKQSTNLTSSTPLLLKKQKVKE